MTKPKLIAAFCAVLYFIQAFLHFLILLGLPLGGFFFGGLYTVFPLWLRPANLFFALIWSFFAYFYLIYGQNSSKPLAQSKAESRHGNNDRAVFISNRF